MNNRLLTRSDGIVRLLLALLIVIQAAALVRGGESPLAALKTIRVLPRTEGEIAAAHERSRGQACEHIGAGEALEISDFIPEFVGGRLSSGGSLPVPTSRRAALSVGLNMLDEDRADLPALTRGRIVDYIDSHYVCVEVRVQRDLGDDELYLHSRPLAATANLAGARLTQGFTDVVAESVQNMRSLGLLVPGSATRTPESYRTLIIIHKSMMLTSETGSKAGRGKPIYEFLFVRGRPAGNSLKLHVFATTQERKRLSYLQPFDHPRRPEQCGICGTIRISEFRLANLLPAESVTRRTSVRSQATFTLEALNSFAQAQGWKGGALDHVTEILDAIIDRKISQAGD